MSIADDRWKSRRCGDCLGWDCPCCQMEREIGLEYRSAPAVDPSLYDCLSWRGRKFVQFVFRPLELMLWAHNLGYQVRIDGEVVELLDAEGNIEYCCWPQHEDCHFDYERAVEAARWM